MCVSNKKWKWQMKLENAEGQNRNKEILQSIKMHSNCGCILMEIEVTPSLPLSLKQLPFTRPRPTWHFSTLSRCLSALRLSLCSCMGVMQTGWLGKGQGGLILFILIEMKFILCTFYCRLQSKRDAIYIYHMDYSYIGMCKIYIYSICMCVCVFTRICTHTHTRTRMCWEFCYVANATKMFAGRFCRFIMARRLASLATLPSLPALARQTHCAASASVACNILFLVAWAESGKNFAIWLPPFCVEFVATCCCSCS